METTYVAAYILCTGPTYTNKAIALGFAIGDGVGNIEETQLFTFPFEDKDFNPEYKKEFWDQQPGLLEMFRNSEFKHTEDAWKTISFWIDNLENRFKSNIVFLCADPGFINHNLCKYAGRAPLHLSKKMQNREINNPSERLSMCPKWFTLNFQKTFSYLHKHNPCSEAEYILLILIYTNKYKNNEEYFLNWRWIGPWF